MRSTARTVDEYLAELDPERREALTAVREVILANLPDGYVETMNWGMAAYEVPLTTYPDTYNGQPLAYAAFAAQKQYMSVYLTGIYGDDSLREWFENAYRATGKRMDLGKSCVRFRSLDDLPLALIGEAVAAIDVDKFCAMHDASSMRASKQRKS